MAKYTIGLDLGQAADYTALVIVEQRDDREHYDARDSAVAARHTLPDDRRRGGRTDDTTRTRQPALVVAATGVGRPVVELFTAAGCHPTGVMITAGSHATQDPDSGYWHVPKKELVSSVQIQLQSGTLQIASALPEARTLTEELLKTSKRRSQRRRTTCTASGERASMTISCWRLRWRSGGHHGTLTQRIWWIGRDGLFVGGRLFFYD